MYTSGLMSLKRLKHPVMIGVSVAMVMIVSLSVVTRSGTTAGAYSLSWTTQRKTSLGGSSSMEAQIARNIRNGSIDVEAVGATQQHDSDPILRTELPNDDTGADLYDDNATNIVLPGQVLMQNGVLQVSCARKYYCEPSSCQPLVIPGTKQGPPIATLQQQLFQNSNNSNTNNISNVSNISNNTRAKPLNIQFWGDSVQEQMECDFRQWYFDSTHNRQQSSSPSPSPSPQAKQQKRLNSEFVQVGCPWKQMCDTGGAEIEHENILKQKASQADIIVVNLGAHYEWEHAVKLDHHLSFLERVFQATIVKKGGLVIVRSPSATHFETSDGLGNYTSIQALKTQYAATNDTKKCGPVSNMPAVIANQVESLKNMTSRLGSAAVYLDVYEISRQRHEEHAFLHGDRGSEKVDPTKLKSSFDCKHFCQSCGVYRAWNILAATQILNSNSWQRLRSSTRVQWVS